MGVCGVKGVRRAWFRPAVFFLLGLPGKGCSLPGVTGSKVVLTGK